ncbi:MAG: SdiA-regulated domain-containing protein [Bacteroidia bacterium]|nr:SdiA-regulated domain-containing protein [Bacteroidia bacterium]
MGKSFGHVFILIFAMVWISCDSGSSRVKKNVDTASVDTLSPEIPDSNSKKAFRPAADWYDLAHPDQDFSLSSSLREISGLGFYQNGLIGAVQDEKGNLYLVDSQNGEIKEKIDFGKHGDYEGVEFVDGEAWILRSDGDLFRIKKPGKKSQKEKHFKNGLGHKYNAEGLGYDARQNRLLVACKGYPGDGKELVDKKAIYAFDLDKKEISNAPVYTLDQEYLFGKTPGFLFEPSGVAVHPTSGDIWVLSHTARGMVVLSPQGDLLRVLELDSDLFPQAEGITFMPDERLVIASEGMGKHGHLLIFNPRK